MFLLLFPCEIHKTNEIASKRKSIQQQLSFLFCQPQACSFTFKFLRLREQQITTIEVKYLSLFEKPNDLPIYAYFLAFIKNTTKYIPFRQHSLQGRSKER